MDNLPQLIYLMLLLVAVGGFLIVEFRNRPGRSSRQLFTWALIFLGVIAVAGLWDDVTNTVSPRQQLLEGGEIAIPISRDGHFYLTAELNGTPIRFVIDTGATTIALSRADARRIGIDPDNLAFIGQARTANGVVATAPVLISSFRLGNIADERVMAVVIDGDLGQPLLGMNYLSRFARVSMEGNRLILER